MDLLHVDIVDALLHLNDDVEEVARGGDEGTCIDSQVPSRQSHVWSGYISGERTRKLHSAPGKTNRRSPELQRRRVEKINETKKNETKQNKTKVTFH